VLVRRLAGRVGKVANVVIDGDLDVDVDVDVGFDGDGDVDGDVPL
jgi:hypothetical protein